MRSALLRLVVAWFGMWTCLLASALVCAALWPQGRGWQIIPAFALALFVFGTVARWRFRWPVRDFIASFAAAVVTALPCISSGSGYRGRELFDWFNLEWLAFCSLIIGAAWFGGLVAGSLLPKATPPS
jgi:hypothetical protein